MFFCLYKSLLAQRPFKPCEDFQSLGPANLVAGKDVERLSEARPNPGEKGEKPIKETSIWPFSNRKYLSYSSIV